jgi:hypothetical protein
MALVVALMSVMLMTALGTALVLTTVIEVTIAASYRDGLAALYAAEAGVERVVPDLAAADWTATLRGETVSTFADGPAAGTRVVGNTTLDLDQLTQLVRCGRTDACTDDDMDAPSEERPWGRNNPRWQLYAHGPVQNLLGPGAIRSRLYVVVWVGDDPSENDNDPLQDGGPPSEGEDENPGHHMLAILSHAYGSGGTRRVIVATAARAGGSDAAAGLRLRSWHEVR